MNPDPQATPEQIIASTFARHLSSADKAWGEHETAAKDVMSALAKAGYKIVGTQDEQN